MTLMDVLGSKSRLRILQELSRRPMYVSELAETVGMDGKTAAHHLETLEEAELVESYHEGNRKYYRLIQVVELVISPPPDRAFILQATEPNGAETD